MVDDSATGGGNHAGLRSSKMDKLLEKLMREVKPAKRLATQRLVFQLASRQSPIIPLYAPRNLGIARKKLTRVVPTALWLDLTRLALK